MYSNVINLGYRDNSTVIPSGVKGLFYLYYKSDNNLYLYDSYRDYEWNLFNLADSNVDGNLIFNLTKIVRGSIKFNLTKDSVSKLIFNLTKIQKGTISFSLTKTSKGTIKFNLTKSPAVGTLTVNIKEVV